MTEDEGIRIDIRRYFPKAARRADILERLRSSWGKVVKNPALVQWSRPVVLGVNELTVEVCNSQAKNLLYRMMGNIKRTLSGFGYDVEEGFKVKIVDTLRPVHKKKNKKAVRKAVADEEKVRQYMESAPDTLPEDINYAVSHLRAYLEAVKKGR